MEGRSTGAGTGWLLLPCSSRGRAHHTSGSHRFQEALAKRTKEAATLDASKRKSRCTLRGKPTCGPEFSHRPSPPPPFATVAVRNRLSLPAAARPALSSRQPAREQPARREKPEAQHPPSSPAQHLSPASAPQQQSRQSPPATPPPGSPPPSAPPSSPPPSPGRPR